MTFETELRGRQGTYYDTGGDARIGLSSAQNACMMPARQAGRASMVRIVQISGIEHLPEPAPYVIGGTVHGVYPPRSASGAG